MKTTTVVLWILGGALVASLGLNVFLMCERSDEPEEALTAAAGTSFSRLGLSDEQLDLIRVTGNRNDVALTRIEAELDRKRRELVDLIDAERCFDPVHASKLAEKIGELQAEGLKRRLRAILVVRECLTPAQFDMLTGGGQ